MGCGEERMLTMALNRWSKLFEESWCEWPGEGEEDGGRKKKGEWGRRRMCDGLKKKMIGKGDKARNERGPKPRRGTVRLGGWYLT